jgi:hypothetical protein
VDELLQRPSFVELELDSQLDKQDAAIAAREDKHEAEMGKIDMEIKGVRRKREERRARLRANALLRNRLESELTEERLRDLFKENLAHLHGVRAGTVPSDRHFAFKESGPARQALFYSMIGDPFTDQQQAWTLEEMSSVWMRNKWEQMDNSEYVERVLMPECFIKFYMDIFSVGKTEAEQRIAETPLRPEDDWDSS